MSLDPNTLEAHFIARLQYFMHMFGEGRINELVDDFYTEDAVIEGPGLPQQTGHEALKAIFSEAAKSYKAIEISMDRLVHPDVNLAYAFITNRNIRNDDVVEIHRASIVWRKVNDKWLCQTDFFYIP
ncbi:MAG: nuclear transport factor 2 family protein [Pseudomonadota bacterium]